MSETQVAVLETGQHNPSLEDSSDLERYDGSRTPADKQLLIWQFDREGRTQTDIARILGMNPRTVKAVIARKDSLIADARMLLKANALEFAHDAITASTEAAKRGKLEGISAMLDRLGVTEPPKSQQQTNVAVQVNLHGGPEPVSLAKVQVESEGRQNQAEISEGLILGVMSPEPSPQVAENATTYERRLTEDVMPAQAATRVTVLQQGNLGNQANKCESPRAGDSRE